MVSKVEDLGLGVEYGYMSEEELARFRVLKNMISTLYGFQKVRTAMDNRLAGLIKEYIDFREIAERVKAEKSEEAIENFQKRYKINVELSSVEEIEKKIRRSDNLGHFAWLLGKYSEFSEIANMAAIIHEARGVEDKTEKQLESWLHNYEIYTKWMKHVSGIKAKLAGGVISSIRTPLRFQNVSKLWQYSGLGHIYFCTECMKYITVRKPMTIGGETRTVLTFGGRSAAEAHADGHGLKYDDCIESMAQRKVEGIVGNWNTFMRTTCWKIAESFVRRGKYYRRAYEIFKAKELEKQQQPQLKKLELAYGWVPYDEDLRKDIMKKFVCSACGYRDSKYMTKCPRCGTRIQAVITKERAAILKKMGYTEIEVVPSGRIVESRARRKVAKLFISHVYDVWMRQLGHDPGKPYANKILGHNFYPPPMPDESGKI